MPDASGSRRDTAHFVNAIKQPLRRGLKVNVLGSVPAHLVELRYLFVVFISMFNGMSLQWFIVFIYQ